MKFARATILWPIAQSRFKCMSHRFQKHLTPVYTDSTIDLFVVTLVNETTGAARRNLQVRNESMCVDPSRNPNSVSHLHETLVPPFVNTNG